MLIPSRVGIALRCPQCGKMDTHEVLLFAFSGSRSVPLACGCGQRLGTLSRRHGRMVLQVACYLCGGLHQHQTATTRFWSGPTQTLLCSETDLHLGAVGTPAAVRSFNSPALDADSLDAAAFADFFVNPEVMYEVLAAVHDLDLAGRLRCCCGNTEIEYELQPDKLELVCPDCGSRRSLAATEDADAMRARRARRMQIGGRRRHGGN